MRPWGCAASERAGLLYARRGFTLVEIMIVVTIMALLAAIAVPNFVRARTTSQRNACINNLRQIDAAKQQWAFDFHATVLAVPTIADIQPYLGRSAAGSQPVCPADPASSFATSYNINEIQSIPTCVISPATHLLNSAVASPIVGGGGAGGGGGGGGGPDGGGGDGGGGGGN
ncbi:MAG TPA: type II secretion system protein [Verrucomicrobiae bacterium]|nr:type II secretion system protein [Verrucomicrobiae bacterium]